MELKDNSMIIYQPLRCIWSRLSCFAVGKESGLWTQSLHKCREVFPRREYKPTLSLHSLLVFSTGQLGFVIPDLSTVAQRLCITLDILSTEVRVP